MRQVSGCSEVFRGFLHVFADFRHFSALREFPCCRVRSLAIFVTFGQLLSCDSPVEGFVRCPFLTFLSQFRHEIPLLKAPFIGPLAPPDGIRERSERALTLVVHLCTLRNF